MKPGLFLRVMIQQLAVTVVIDVPSALERGSVFWEQGALLRLRLRLANGRL
jgi:hypothetical protein